MSDNIEKMEGLEDVEQDLEKAEITISILSSVDFEQGEFVRNVAGADVESDAVMREVSGQAVPEQADSAQEDAVLWITDIPEIGGKLLADGQAVLALLQKDSENAGFSGVLFACINLEGVDADYLDKVYRRYRNIPWDIPQTERCLLRETVEEDVEAFWRIYSEPEITRYTEALYSDKEEERQYISDYRRLVYGFWQFGVWTVLAKETGEVIGRAGLSMREGYEEPELGFVIAFPWQHKGIAREICSAILEYGRDELGFEKVQAFVRPENEASRKLCRSLGMEEKERAILDGIPHIRTEITF